MRATSLIVFLAGASARNVPSHVDQGKYFIPAPAAAPKCNLDPAMATQADVAIQEAQDAGCADVTSRFNEWRSHSLYEISPLSPLLRLRRHVVAKVCAPLI